MGPRLVPAHELPGEEGEDIQVLVLPTGHRVPLWSAAGGSLVPQTGYKFNPSFGDNLDVTFFSWMSWGEKSDIDTVYKLSTDAWEKLGKIWLRVKVSYCNGKCTRKHKRKFEPH